MLALFVTLLTPACFALALLCTTSPTSAAAYTLQGTPLPPTTSFFLATSRSVPQRLWNQDFYFLLPSPTTPQSCYPRQKRQWRRGERFAGITSKLTSSSLLLSRNPSECKSAVVLRMSSRYSPNRDNNDGDGDYEAAVRRKLDAQAKEQEKQQIIQYLERRKEVSRTTDSGLGILAVAVILFFLLVVAAFGSDSLFGKVPPTVTATPPRVNADSILRQDFVRLDSSVSFGD